MGIKIVCVEFDYDEFIDGKFSERLTKSVKIAVRNLNEAQNKAMRKCFGNGQEMMEWNEDGITRKHKINYSKIVLRRFEILEEED